MNDEGLPSSLMRRRAFLRTATAGIAGIAAAGSATACTTTQGAVPQGATRRSGSADTVRLGVASYSLRQFPRAEAIRMVQALGTPFINIKSNHLEYELTPAELAAGRREFEAAGLRIVGGGTITFREDTDEEVRRYFEYARHSGMPLIVATCDPRILPRVERFAREYDIRVAIHNHGPEDRFYPSPYDVLEYIGTMDPRMGVCNDIGHTVRTGVDVVRSVVDAGPRLFDLHIKDLRDLTDPDSQVAVGEGNIPMAEIFAALMRMNYQGYANLEYEINPRDPLPGMQRSFAHMRGILAGLGARQSARA
jgi:sugar phosphate isomerase/epimerase